MSCGLCDTKTRRCDRGSRVLSVGRCIYGRETKFMRHVALAPAESPHAAPRTRARARHVGMCPCA